METSRLVGGVAGGLVGGYAAATLCFVVLGPTTGPLSLSCLLIGGGTVGAVMGSRGGDLGEHLGEKLYEY